MMDFETSRAVMSASEGLDIGVSGFALTVFELELGGISIPESESEKTISVSTMRS